MKRQPANSRRKASSPKADWREARSPYTWHLRLPFESPFDRSHWWKGKPESEIEAAEALYELARRHPLVAAARMGIFPDGWTKNRFLDPLFFLSEYGLASWPKLDGEFPLQAVWKKVAGNMKGVDCRDDSARCSSLERNALDDIALKRMFTAKRFQTKIMKQKTFGVLSRLVERDMVKNPPPAHEVEAKIKRGALAAYRAGYLLIAVAPNMTAVDAEGLMAQEFSRHQELRRLRKLRNQRARWNNWLDLISQFEGAEVGNEKAKSQVFIRYRRALDGIRF